MLALAVPRLAAPVLVLAAAIAYSRVYLGVHYPLDVIAGAALGRSCRYSSSPACSSPATITATAASQADPDADAAAAGADDRIGDRDQPDQDEHGRERAERDDDQRLGRRGRELEADAAKRGEADDGEADQEDELAGRAAVPAGHGQGRPLDGMTRIPARERGHGEHEASGPGSRLPEREDAGPRTEADVSKLAWGRSPPLGLRRVHGSDTEDVLHLLEDQHHDHGHRQQEASEHEPEAKPRPLACAPLLDARRATSAVVVVGPARPSADRASGARRAGSGSVPARPRGKV